MEKLNHYTSYALAALRIVAALIFMEHGTQKLFGFPAPPEGGLPAVGSLFWIGGWIELVGGTMLLLGLFTRPVAFIVAGQMAVAYWMFHASASFYPVLNGGDAAILYTFVFLLLAVAGPGAWSLDGLRHNRLPGQRNAADGEQAVRKRKRSRRALVYQLLQNP